MHHLEHDAQPHCPSNSKMMKLDPRKAIRVFALLLAVLSIIITSFLLAQYFVAPIIIWIKPGWEQPFYELGAYGSYRAQKYVTLDLASPWMSTPIWDDSCDHGYVFFDLSGTAVPNRGPAIVHPTGELIYTSDQFGISLNSAIRTYQGKNYLSFWAGKKAKTSGEGYYYMLDSAYRVIHKISAVGDGVFGDLHEFQITPQGTALMTVYNATRADLTSMGWFHGSDGWITDGIFQEVDIATGKLLFEWRASDYFQAADSHMWNPLSGFNPTAPFDFFHINSVDKDARGNYLISSRHLHILVYIDGKTGQPIWTLGGSSTDFEDLSDGQASRFSWQHDARWVSRDDGIISFFDNGMAWPHVDAEFSQGRMIQVNEQDRTVTLLHTYESLQQAHSSSQGSVQILDDVGNQTHAFVGWGSSAIFTEHALDGTLLCEKHFGSSAYFFWERVKSYRAFKFPVTAWIAGPADWDPVAKIRSNTVYVSWNGATTVVLWELQGTKRNSSSTSNEEFEAVDIVSKERRFETAFALPDNEIYSAYRVAALDADKNVLRYSNIATREPSSSWFTVAHVMILAFVLVCAFLALAYARKRGLWFTRITNSMNWFHRHKYQKLW